MGFIRGLTGKTTTKEQPSTPEPTYIEISASTKNWDADAEKDGLEVELQIFTDPYDYIKASGTLEVALYYDVGLTTYQKGSLIEEWTKELTVDDFNVGTCGGNKCGFTEFRLEYKEPHRFSITSFGYLEAKFTTKTNTYKAIDTSLPLT